MQLGRSCKAKGKGFVLSCSIMAVVAEACRVAIVLAKHFFSKEITDDWCDYEARGRQHDAKVTGDDAALLRSIAVEVVGVPRRAAFACCGDKDTEQKKGGVYHERSLCFRTLSKA
ncbi:hypothetical protein PVAP13_7KG150555 [Panicum virgatum]|uniref:Uncharacterized protein n=1 Tax=Panicum virgatum TaxID=38727 RepID=A0A8T0QH31_PANVG|nr:hypothetical protein PVAP13_7KG150555 [Panicum virgatum]